MSARAELEHQSRRRQLELYAASQRRIRFELEQKCSGRPMTELEIKDWDRLTARIGAAEAELEHMLPWWIR